ncbi:MAG: hypothetical protein U9N35_04655 [Euryarchaeota archaeon]|nr:hypothetical protein [Euryarchaeota archaeon]
MTVDAAAVMNYDISIAAEIKVVSLPSPLKIIVYTVVLKNRGGCRRRIRIIKEKKRVFWI